MSELTIETLSKYLPWLCQSAICLPDRPFLYLFPWVSSTIVLPLDRDVVLYLVRTGSPSDVSLGVASRSMFTFLL